MPPSLDELQRRIRDLEDQARITLDVLDMAASLGDFQTSINMMQAPEEILHETARRIQSFSHFRAISFYTVDESSSDFVITTCEPVEYRETLIDEVDILINNGIFAMAIREDRPVTVYSSDNRNRLILHSLATSSRTRGMFVGLLSRIDTSISAMLLALVSIILKNAANALESYELYSLLRTNEQRFQALVEVVPSTIFELDSTGRLRFVNHTLSRQFRYDRAEFLASHPVWHLAVTEERETFRLFLLEHIEDQTSGSIPLLTMDAQGETHPAVIHVSPIRDTGAFQGLRGAITILGEQALPACWIG